MSYRAAAIRRAIIRRHCLGVVSTLWMESRCWYTSGRSDWASELRRHQVQIDLYLRYFSRRCSMPNTLYYGDNLEILRQHVPDESVDLVYRTRPLTPMQATTCCSRSNPARSRRPRSRHSPTPGSGPRSRGSGYSHLVPGRKEPVSDQS